MNEAQAHNARDIGLEPFTSADDVRQFLRSTRAWGRWGTDDQRGAHNLIDSPARLRAARVVQTGEVVSLGRPLATEPGPGNPKPVRHYMERGARAQGSGVARDYFAMSSHGTVTTHMDALSHVWDGDGLWGGVAASEAIDFDGAKWGGIEHWSQGFFTRGVLLNVPAHRGTSFVERDRPVMAEELQAILEAQGVTLEPGDAVVVYSGRDQWDAVNEPYGSDAVRADDSSRPGLDISCLKFLYRYDCSMLVWDMTDHRPIPFGLAYGVHSALFAYGIALVDSAELGELARKCAEVRRSDFLLVAVPLQLRGGTATPVNPIAVL